jgi:hypothetical protein
MFWEHNPSHTPTGRKPSARYQGSMGTMVLVHHGQPACQEIFHQEMPAHCYSSVGTHHGDGEWRMFAILPAVGQVQLDHFEVKPNKVVFSEKKNEPVTLLCVNFLVK